MIPSIYRTLLLAAAAALVAACSSAPIPEDSFYRLGNLPEPTSVFSTYPLDGRLLIELPRAAGIRRQRGILYSADPDHVELRRYHYHFWEDAPPEMLHRRLIERLRDAAAAPVITERLTAQVDYRLRSRIRRFERDVEGANAYSVVAIDIMIFPGDGRGDAVFRGSYVQREAAASMRMIDTATAFSRALDAVLDSFLQELGSAE